MGDVAILEIISALGGLITSSSFSSNNSTHTIKENIYRERFFIKGFLESCMQLLGPIQKILETNASLNNTSKMTINGIHLEVMKDYHTLYALYIETNPEHMKANDNLRAILTRIKAEAPPIVEQMESRINTMMELVDKKEFSSPLIISNNYFSNNPRSANHANKSGNTTHVNSSMFHVASVTPNATIANIHTPNGNVYNEEKAKELRSIIEKNKNSYSNANKEILATYQLNEKAASILKEKTKKIRSNSENRQLSPQEIYTLNRSTAHSRAKTLRLGGNRTKRTRCNSKKTRHAKKHSRRGTRRV